MNIAVVIVTYNSADTLRACLDALARQTMKPARTLIVDNASPMGFPSDAVKGRDVELIFNDRNVGFAAANNQALARLYADPTVDCVALLNPDAFPEPDWLAQLAAAALRHQDADAFASRLMAAGTDLLDGAGDQYHVSGLAWRAGHGLNVSPKYLVERDVFAACAAAAMYRVKSLRRVDGFDAALFCYFEDVDLSVRLRRLGGRCVYVPSAVVWHVGAASTKSDPNFRLYYGHRNMVRVFLKDMPTPLLLLALPAHLIVNVIGIARGAWRGQAALVVRAKLDALKSLPEIVRQRRAIQRQATVGAWGMLKHMRMLPWRDLDAAAIEKDRD